MSLVLRIIAKNLDGGLCFDGLVGPFENKEAVGEWLKSKGFAPLSKRGTSERRKGGSFRADYPNADSRISGSVGSADLYFAQIADMAAPQDLNIS